MRLIDIDKHFEINKVFYEVDLKVPLREVKEVLEHAPTVEAIPIEWIIDWLNKQTIPALRTCDDYEAVKAVNMMLDDWEKENEAD